ncbi:hypothetical protein STEG23_029958, partial [Scotinomys teguina]
FILIFLSSNFVLDFEFENSLTPICADQDLHVRAGASGGQRCGIPLKLDFQTICELPDVDADNRVLCDGTMFP